MDASGAISASAATSGSGSAGSGGAAASNPKLEAGKRKREAGDKNPGPAAAAAPPQTIAQLVRAARARTNKAARPDDEKLVAWLKQQEVATAQEFVGLSPESLASVASSAPGASLLLMDALRQLRTEARAAAPEDDAGCAFAVLPRASTGRAVRKRRPRSDAPVPALGEG